MNTVQRIANNTGSLKGECYTMAEEWGYPSSSLSLQVGRACVYDRRVGGAGCGAMAWTSL